MEDVTPTPYPFHQLFSYILLCFLLLFPSRFFCLKTTNIANFHLELESELKVHKEIYIDKSWKKKYVEIKSGRLLTCLLIDRQTNYKFIDRYYC
jgi:hypothetical protein